MKHDETRSVAPGARGRRFHQGRLFDAAIVEPTVEAQRAKARVPQFSGLAGMLDDRDDARAQPTQPGPKWQRCRERRRVGGEVARRLIEPAAEIRLHVGLTDEREHVVGVHATKRADGAAPLVLDEPAQDDVGARCHVALQPVAAPRTWDVEAVTAFRDDALETVFGDDVEERLAVLCQMLWHRDHTAADPERSQAAAALFERTTQ